MSRVRVLAAAGARIDDIYDWTRGIWGDAQADRYVRGLFARFDEIAARHFPWRPIPAVLGVEGFVCRHERHVIYWRLLANGDVGIVTVLHERMHQVAQLREDLGP
jgi:toxin ParE1/3/4